MIGRQIGRGRGWGETLALALAFALSVPALAVAPPVPVPDVPGPGPVFNPDEIHTSPVHMALAVLGGSGIRGSGPVVATATVVAGEKAGSWDLGGVMTNRYSRVSFGAAMLLSGGLTPGNNPIGQLATLQFGQSLDCWALQNTDKLLYLPPGDLRVIQDGTRIAEWGPEALIYGRFLIRSFFTSPAAFATGVRTDLTYTHLLGDPARYRGEVVRVEGRLLRINTFPPPYEAEREGVTAIYEAWIFNEVFGASPYCVVTT